jgi:hypothetical protein
MSPAAVKRTRRLYPVHRRDQRPPAARRRRPLGRQLAQRRLDRVHLPPALGGTCAFLRVVVNVRV